MTQPCNETKIVSLVCRRTLRSQANLLHAIDKMESERFLSDTFLAQTLFQEYDSKLHDGRAQVRARREI